MLVGYRTSSRLVRPLYRAAIDLVRRRTRLVVAATVAALALVGIIAGLSSGGAVSQAGARDAAGTSATVTSAKPYTLYDSTTPSAIPAGQPAASYTDGSYAASPSQLSGHSVIWIDTNGSAPKTASALDVEPGDATPAQAATWAQARLTANPHGVARIYTMLSEWPATKAAIATLPASMQSHIRWWIADPTGVKHMVPGADATQWYWGSSIDISTASPGF